MAVAGVAKRKKEKTLLNLRTIFVVVITIKGRGGVYKVQKLTEFRERPDR